MFSHIQTNEHPREDVVRMFQQSAGFFTTTPYDVNDLKTMEKLVEMNRYSVRNVMDMVQSSCDETFVRCRFEGRFVNCSDLFKPVTSQHGLCCTFNKNNLYK